MRLFRVITGDYNKIWMFFICFDPYIVFYDEIRRPKARKRLRAFGQIMIEIPRKDS
jgi:hypothetical protein